MNIHEHQAKDLLRSFGVPVANGRAITAIDEAASAIQELSGPVRVVKAQIHAGGRGKGRFADAPEGAPGGVRVTKSSEEAEQAVADMLGRTLVTHQTGPEGKKVQRVYVEEGCDIRRELYLALLIDRGTSRLSFVASTEGGMDIEEVAASTPERILTVTIDPASGISDFHARKIAFGLGLTGPAIRDCRNLVSKLYEMFVSKDCELVEINPLVVDGEDRLICLDAKVSFDGNALDRHPDIKALRDLAEEDEREVSASEFGLNYIALDGEIGCLVNGAGLAMATMDIIKLYGSEPANFLDVGGGATREQVTEAFKLITSDPKVKGILVNIFGGIMRCDVIAEGIVSAVRDVGLHVPLVVRLEGTNVEIGQEILSNSGLGISTASDLGDAARQIIAEVRA